MTIGHHSRPLLRWATALALLLPAAPARAADVLGPAECIRCHNHSLQAERWQKKEVEQLGKKAHFNTLAQLRLPEAIKIARLAGVRPDDPRCVACHGTVVRGRPRAGVSCESCHGPGSGYNEPHQKPNQYEASVALGMADLRVKPANIVEVCVRCHVTTDGDFRDAGHPTGEKFDVATALARIEHWVWEKRRTVIDMAEVGRLGRAAVARQVAKIPPPKPRAEGTADATAPTPSGRGLDPAAAQPLPADYTEPMVDAGGSAGGFESFDAGAAAAPAGASPFAAARAAQSTAAGAKAPATTRSRLALRQEALKLLLDAIRAGRGPSSKDFAPGEYAGADSELLRLQDELLALALRPAPAATPAPDASPSPAASPAPGERR